MEAINAACGDSFTVCATQENHVFSWGNCKDGRLGLDLTVNRIDTNTICLPRPIFGSLYLVSDMCSRFWNSIIIAEQVIDAKAVRSISHNKSAISSSNVTKMNSLIDSDYGTFEKYDVNNEVFDVKIKVSLFDNIPQCSQVARSIASSNMPEWLKNDLQDADFIPIDALKPPAIPFSINTSTTTQTPSVS